MKLLLPLLLLALGLVTTPVRSQEIEPDPPADEHPLHTNAKRFAKRAAGDAAAAIAKGDRKSALASYAIAVSQIPEAESLRGEYYLYRARFAALALQLAADAIDGGDVASARVYLGEILAPEMDPENALAKNLLQTIDPQPVAVVDPTTPAPVTPVVPVTPAPDPDAKWSHTIGDALPEVNREWGFLLFKGIDPGILVSDDTVELVRDGTVLATFKATIPLDTTDSLVLGVRAPSPIPDTLRKGDVFRLKTE